MNTVHDVAPAIDTDLVLDVQALQVRYGAVAALQGVSLTVGPGELVTVVGANGAGKSSLVKAICGVVASAGGRITALGADVKGRSPEAIARSGVSLVPEGRRIFGALTVAENLRVGTLGRKDRGTVAGETEAVLDRFPALRAAYKRPADKLSGGQAQQLAIARSLLTRPRLLMLDEPSLGLAPVIADEIFTLLDDLRRGGMTILLIEQNVTRAVELADRSIVLSGGNVVLSAVRADLPPADEIAAAILGIS
jgi:branched-chain amino acid transport system ATP-binding protein